MKLSYRTQRNAEAVSKVFGKPLNKPDWYEIKAASDEETEILIYDYIGWPFNDAGDFVRALAAMTAKSITVRINSPGGDVFDALAIFNALKGYSGKIITKIEALAASAASFIALAGKEVQAYQNAMFMIHEPLVYTAGNQYDLREVADILGKVSDNMVDIYAQESNAGKREIRDMMKAETWMTAKEAKEKGFVDTIIDGKAVKAQFDLSVFAHAPEDLTGERAGRTLTEREVERALRDAGASRSFAKAVAAGCSNGTDAGDQRDVESLSETIKAMISKFKKEN